MSGTFSPKRGFEGTRSPGDHLPGVKKRRRRQPTYPLHRTSFTFNGSKMDYNSCLRSFESDGGSEFEGHSSPAKLDAASSA